MSALDAAGRAAALCRSCSRRRRRAARTHLFAALAARAALAAA